MDPTTELASDFTVARYTELRPQLAHMEPDACAWREVIDAMRQRIEERFLTPIRELSRFDELDNLPYRPGFAILALDCLLIDTIQSFREGRVSTGEVSPAHSFKSFLSAPSFSDFTNSERGNFFHYVRNAVLHNGETRKDWKIRIDTGRMIERDSSAKTTTLNRQYFHAAVEGEFELLFEILKSGDTEARQQFLRRMDAMAGLPADPLRHLYFCYGSNLKDAECRKTAQQAQPYGVAYLPGYRLVFTKHSTTRGGDAATVRRDPISMVWGYVYRVSDEDQKKLKKREGGYKHIPAMTVYLVPPTPGDDPSPLTAFTFEALSDCPQRCGPKAQYLDIIIQGAEERKLPNEYRQTLVELREALSNKQVQLDTSDQKRWTRYRLH